MASGGTMRLMMASLLSIQSAARGPYMRFDRVGLFALILSLSVFGLSTPLVAQQGSLTGIVTDTEFGVPVAQVRVQVLGGSGVETLSNDEGRYTFQLPPGSYSLVFESVGYRAARADNVRVSPGESNSFDMMLQSTAFALDPLIVTAGRTRLGEKETEAAATSMSISSIEIEERPAASFMEHLRSAPGVDIITYGIQGGNVTLRGFNNIFSGGLHMLTDNRLAGVPSLRVNLMHFIPSNEADVDRMEVVLGPGSALYGPNTANGVVHIITKSPLESQGTSVTLGAGQRSVLQGSFRSAFKLADNFGVKVSGQALTGNEWEYDDPTELANRAAADASPALCLGDKVIRGFSEAEAQIACNRLGQRDYDIERFGLEARADWQFADNGTFIGTYGRNQSSGVELTGLGAGQTQDWVYQFYQGRVSYDRFFAQAYMNSSDAGSSFLLNNGVPLVDRSKLWVAQAQHGFDLWDGRQDFTYGFDYFGTRPDTDGKVNGQYEDSDEMDEWGAYVQSKTALTPDIDFVLAARMDSHSILPDNVFSPRAALILKTGQDKALRFTYNQAYSSPSSLNYFLDISNGFAPGLSALGFGLRAYGTGRDGWSVINEDGTVTGFRSPFNADRSQVLPIQAATAFWPAAIGVLQAQVAGGALPASLAPLLTALGGLSPTAADIGSMLFNPISGDMAPSSAASSLIRPIETMQESNTETFEIGWTGIIEDRVKITADLYYSKLNNFVSPLLLQTPLVTFRGQDIANYITVPVVTALTQAFIAGGLDPETAAAQAQAQAATVIPQLAGGLAAVPVGVVSSSEFSPGSDLIVSYRSVGDLSLFGSDFAMQWFLTDQWTLGGTYSWVSKEQFPVLGSNPISLNAPRQKGTVSMAYRDVAAGFNASARLRFNGSFSANSAGFAGEVPSTNVVDVGLGYQVPSTRATLQLAVQNVFDSENFAFVGVPSIGRYGMVKVKYDLF